MTKPVEQIAQELDDETLLANLRFFADLCGDAREKNKFRHATLAIVLQAAHDRITALNTDEVRREALEEAATLAESHATCGCNGKHGPCNADDAPLSIAAEIRALIASKEEGRS